MKYTQIPTNTFKNLQLNAGILMDEFTPATGTVGNLIGATTGGVTFTATPTFKDYGDDIDNCPKNMMELKKLDSWEAKMSGTFVAIDAAAAKMLIGAADVDSADATHIVPRNDIAATDFDDVWWVGDYSDINVDGASSGHAGFVAIHLLNGLSTGGFSIKTGDKSKGNFDFEFTGHYSMSAQDTVPFEVYVSAGSNT